MCPVRKNHTNFYNRVNAAFGETVRCLFISEYHGTKLHFLLLSVRMNIFLLGDNSSGSFLDSRVFGHVRRKDIRWQVTRIVFPLSRIRNLLAR